MLYTLPLEILQVIINNLSLKDLIKLRTTNKVYQELVKNYNSYDNVRISGSLKYWKKSFPNLKYANISRRKDISDQDFQYLDNIEKLDMNLCYQITYKGFNYLSKIKDLNLQGSCQNQHFDFDNFSNLEKLYIDNNHIITDNGIKKMLKIKDLSISNCSQITNDGFSSLTKLVKLYIYNLYNLTDDIFKNMTDLQCLYITFCNFTDQGILLLKKIKKLRFLNCKNIKGTDFDQLTELNNIEFTYCGPNDDSMYYLKNISDISFYGCNIDGSGFKYLENLQVLSIYESPIKDEYLDLLLELKNLKKVNIYRCSLLSKNKKDQFKKILGNKFETD